MGIRDTLFVSHIPPKTDKKHRDMAYLTDITRHDNRQGCKLSKIESVRLGLLKVKRKCHVELCHVRTCKPSLKGSIYGLDIEPQRLDLLEMDIV